MRFSFTVIHFSLDNYVYTPSEATNYTHKRWSLVENGTSRPTMHKEYPFTAKGLREAHIDLTPAGGKTLVSCSTGNESRYSWCTLSICYNHSKTDSGVYITSVHLIPPSLQAFVLITRITTILFRSLDGFGRFGPDWLVRSAARLKIIKPFGISVWPRWSHQEVLWDADGVDYYATFDAYIVSATNPDIKPVWLAGQKGAYLAFELHVPESLSPGNYQILFVEVDGNDNTYRSDTFQIV
ncbi:hypothetical protein JVU11DRAFT_3900 [Chiua virens]|nr:hypothetical protein JVU11DRAFT_3900 [Chiua virens]